METHHVAPGRVINPSHSSPKLGKVGGREEHDEEEDEEQPTEKSSQRKSEHEPIFI